jgi:hypothetical protein
MRPCGVGGGVCRCSRPGWRPQWRSRIRLPRWRGDTRPAPGRRRRRDGRRVGGRGRGARRRRCGAVRPGWPPSRTGPATHRWPQSAGSSNFNRPFVGSLGSRVPQSADHQDGRHSDQVGLNPDNWINPLRALQDSTPCAEEDQQAENRSRRVADDIIPVGHSGADADPPHMQVVRSLPGGQFRGLDAARFRDRSANRLRTACEGRSSLSVPTPRSDQQIGDSEKELP